MPIVKRQAVESSAHDQHVGEPQVNPAPSVVSADAAESLPGPAPAAAGARSIHPPESIPTTIGHVRLHSTHTVEHKSGI